MSEIKVGDSVTFVRDLTFCSGWEKLIGRVYTVKYINLDRDVIICSGRSIYSCYYGRISMKLEEVRLSTEKEIVAEQLKRLSD